MIVTQPPPAAHGGQVVVVHEKKKRKGSVDSMATGCLAGMCAGMACCCVMDVAGDIVDALD